jgi:pimeloyl-ACP methyl ester carboxylesterase
MSQAMHGLLICSAVMAPLSVASDAWADRHEGTIKAADGTTIAYEVGGDGEPALVFVHCWSCNRGFWREQLGLFAEDYTVVALDLPGHGASGRDRKAWSLEAYADDVSRLVEELDLDRVVLVGHSMGGPVSLLAAAKLEERVIGVICADTLHDAAFKMPEEALQGWVQSFEQDYEAGMRQAVTSMVPSAEALRAWIVEEALKADRGATKALIPELGAFDLAAALSAVDVPVRCVNAVPYGEYALPTAIETNRRYADFDAVLVDGVGHFLQLERPEAFNPRMREMLEQIAGTTAGASE